MNYEKKGDEVYEEIDLNERGIDTKMLPGETLPMYLERLQVQYHKEYLQPTFAWFRVLVLYLIVLCVACFVATLTLHVQLQLGRYLAIHTPVKLDNDLMTLALGLLHMHGIYTALRYYVIPRVMKIWRVYEFAEATAPPAVVGNSPVRSRVGFYNKFETLLSICRSSQACRAVVFKLMMAIVSMLVIEPLLLGILLKEVFVFVFFVFLN
jgi:hypothetical protein